MKPNVKKIVSYLYFVTLILLAGCSKKLEEQPKTFISPDRFFQNVTQCTQAVKGVYIPLNDIFGQESLWLTTEAGTDLTVGSQTYTESNYTYTPGSPGTSYGMWNKLYVAIINANFVINRIGKSPIDAAAKAKLIGEAKFLRGMFYFMLSNLFGDVPYYETEVNGTTLDKIGSLARTPLPEVRDSIIKDLQYAITNLPVSYAAAETGRATKGAAQALLAKVFLYNKDWVNAQSTAQQVVDGGQYILLTNYANLFDVNGGFKNNKESIFEIQYRRDAAANINYKVHYYYTWYFPFQVGNTFGGVDFGTTTLIGYELLYPTQKMANLFEAGDKRKPVVVSFDYNGQSFTRLPKPGRPWFGPKFWDLQANERNSGKNLYFLRYADVILTLAEAMNEQNNTAGCITELNKIRTDHAGLPDLTPGLSQDSLRSLIRNERGIEFVGEFQRKWDLARWGILAQSVQSAQGTDNTLAANNVREFHRYFPIPAAEIVKNPNLTQNTGY